MMKPRLLDLFCGAGGAAVGYSRAGFDVVGVDHLPQKHYPFTFVLADALEYVAEHGREFDAIHASPPCQAFTKYKNLRKDLPAKYPDLITNTRELLRSTGLFYVIENVEGAPLLEPVVLCGSMFGLDVRRHRLFETTVPLDVPSCNHKTWEPNRYPGGRSIERGGAHVLCRGTVEIGKWSIPLAIQKEAMGIDWMVLEELSEAIPPAYTEFIGKELLKTLKVTS